VLDTLIWLHDETDVWLEVTTLLIPGLNDLDREIVALCEWFVRHLGPDVPLHFTAFHPDFKMLDVAPTPVDTLRRARSLAFAAGLRFVYTGNVHDPDGQATLCPDCGARIIGRDGYAITGWGLDGRGCCRGCGAKLPGHFAS
jgi:pyruvate formate lyase activating enzyme